MTQPKHVLGVRPNAWFVDETTADISRPPLPPTIISLQTDTKIVRLDLTKSACLVIDMQNDFCHPNG
ncbi:MAG: hypothetical protein KME43_22440 [Myxacorys chilensis ATA2-1-KO14]|jgi:isochorismate hydrolase|nr:hypothetical protein [Myxacorys chilensis ATA2-1-KO14]